MVAYPKGLIQPDGCGKFSLETLLLAAYSANIANRRKGALQVMELGAGCGAALLGYSLLRPMDCATGLEREYALFEAARKNAALLEVEERCKFLNEDINECSMRLIKQKHRFDLVIANPPWRQASAGKIAKTTLRKNAYWEITGTLADFLNAAAFFLKRHGYLCLILPVWQLGKLFADAQNANLGLRQLQPISSFMNTQIKRLLVFCQKNAKSDYQFNFPLVIHEKKCDRISYTAEVKKFCPWLV